MRVLFAVAFVGCNTSGAPHNVTLDPAPSSSAQPQSSGTLQPKPVASEDSSATVGDVTCQSDGDCAVTTMKDCCECCPRRALATSKKWLAWRDERCAATRCAGCDESCPPEQGAAAVCQAGKCALIRGKLTK